MQAYTILLLPLISAILIASCFRTSKKIGVAISVSVSVLIFALSFLLLTENDNVYIKECFEYFKLGTFKFDIGVYLDSLSANLLFVVTFIGMLIHIFSVGYMKDDSAKGRFFGALSFFMFSMLGIVLSSNLFMMFVFWELVGFSSYMLIAHYADTPAAKEASKKAFIANRVGDLGFLIGIIYCWSTFGTTDFADLSQLSPEVLKGGLTTAMGLLLMCGFIGKSAQFPLHVWLADAMAGPTPVSALIHAATMVAAGIFMMARLFACGLLTPEVREVLILISSAMACFASFWALGQRDIKKILAYSTLAHLGIMGVGISLFYSLGMFHLITHAFFKATLFLSAGSIICACHHQQDIFKMGGLFKKMPITAISMLLAGISLMSIPYTAGYYSKDAILLNVYEQTLSGGMLYDVAFVFMLFAALLSPLYMGRLYFNVFFGKAKSEEASHAKESSIFMTLPLILLSVYAIGVAWSYLYDIEWLNGIMNGLLPSSLTLGNELAELVDVENLPNIHMIENLLLVGTFVMLLLAYILYGRGSDLIMKKLPLLYYGLNKHGWFDDIYDYYVVKVQQRLINLMAFVVDLFTLDLVVIRGSASILAIIGYGFKKLHNCVWNMQVAYIIIGIILFVVLILAK